MDYSKIVRDIINYIEDDLYRDFSQETILKDMPLSNYHLHHLFQSITGYTLMEYVDRRRISDQMYRWAAMNKKFSIAEAALKCDYKKPRAFLRQLKSYFDVSPNQYYKSFTGYELFPNFNLYKYLNNPARSSVDIETEIVELDEFTLYGRSINLKHEDYAVNAEKQKYSVVSNSRFTDALEYTYFTGSKDSIQGGERLSIPKSKYICFEGISDTWFYEQATRYLYSTYLINESIDISTDQIDIIQENDFNDTYNKYHKVKIYIPLKKRL
ncbi:AraC family transcriptional regulator [Acidaminobacter sp. JC074]|uniref:AraC family transcriptional regulator n=1 Tax=Acidaminobacter sp. JC074 TaxID=2530199 RepID=UPI001F11125E|nr:AraC family transcriptional regulator [Acidaminobacter sp. JC074]MCH4887064.1 AraC family transcriptional regulator [Acidaminobacter sp. JC074]